MSDQQSAVGLVTVGNEATWAPGTFSISKSIEGVLLDDPDVPETVLTENLIGEFGTADLVFLAGVAPEEFETWVETCRGVEADNIPDPPRALAAFLDANGFGVSV